MTETLTSSAGGIARARAEDLLARYPDLVDEELGELVVLFRQKLAAIDQALIASDDVLGPRYHLFKAEHLSKLTPRDLLNAGLVAIGLAGPIVALAYYYSL